MLKLVPPDPTQPNDENGSTRVPDGTDTLPQQDSLHGPASQAARARSLSRPPEATHIPPDGLKVGIVGAGISGLIAAHSLRACGLEVKVFDKARGPGGRTSTRRHNRPSGMSGGETPLSFDHGAQYFTARDPLFRRYVDSWIEDGVVAPWDGRIAAIERGQMTPKHDGPTRFVGIPKMSAVARHLTADLDVAYQSRVETIERTDGQWRLTSDRGEPLDSFDVVVVSTPPAQAEPLLADAPRLAKQAAAVTLQPCWATMLVFERELDLPFDGAFVGDSPLSWVARNGSKPGRPEGECWVLHGSPEWSAQHVGDDAEAVTEQLLDAFRKATGQNHSSPIFARTHRWLYSIADHPLESGCLWDEELQIGACGDWCHGSRVEGAFLSGMKIACRVLDLPQEMSAKAPLAAGCAG